MMSQIYNVGILGCANIATRSLIPAFTANVRFHFTAIASRNVGKAEFVARQTGCKAYGSYDDLLDDAKIDLVYIPLPTGLHHEWVMKALRKGKHVMCEKSLGVSYHEVQEMVTLAKERKLLLIENFQFRFHSQHQWAKELLASGQLGEVRCFRSSFGFPPFKDSENIRYSHRLGGGALLDAGAYTLKALQFMLPGESFTLRCATVCQPPESDVDLWGGIYLDSKTGIVAELSYGFDNFYQCNYEIWGSKGKLTCTRAFTAPAGFSPLMIFENHEGKKEISLPADNHFDNMIAHIADCLDNKEYEEEYTHNLKQAGYLQQVKMYIHGK